jgi:hypothetical protein
MNRKAAIKTRLNANAAIDHITGAPFIRVNSGGYSLPTLVSLWLQNCTISAPKQKLPKIAGWIAGTCRELARLWCTSPTPQPAVLTTYAIAPPKNLPKILTLPKTDVRPG